MSIFLFILQLNFMFCEDRSSFNLQQSANHQFYVAVETMPTSVVLTPLHAAACYNIYDFVASSFSCTVIICS